MLTKTPLPCIDGCKCVTHSMLWARNQLIHLHLLIPIGTPHISKTAGQYGLV